MRYLALIYSDEKVGEAMTPAEQNANMAAWFAYHDALTKTGMMVTGEALQPTLTATTVRAGANGALVTDGPFAETKEQLGGFYLLSAENLDQAIAAVSTMPNLGRGGCVELRPIMEFGEAGT